MSASPDTECRSYFGLALMMVFAVVGVLLFVGVLAPFVINRGPTHSPEVRLLTEVAMLDSAFKVYKERHGEYPPSDFDHLDNVNSPQYVALANHLKQAFPDADVKVEIAAIKSLGVRTPAQAVCFWLSGFAVERTRPVSSMHTGLSASREAPIYDFEKTRLRFFKPGDQVPVYVPNGGEGAPYLYFAAVSYATQAPFCAVDWKGAGNGTARPYLSDKAPGQFVNPNSFQIISAGLDGDYGGGVGSFPSSKGYERGDYDNIVNFSDRNLGDAVPH